MILPILSKLVDISNTLGLSLVEPSDHPQASRGFYFSRKDSHGPRASVLESRSACKQVRRSSSVELVALRAKLNLAKLVRSCLALKSYKL